MALPAVVFEENTMDEHDRLLVLERDVVHIDKTLPEVKVDIKEIKADMKSGFAETNKKIDDRFGVLDKKIDDKFGTLDQKIEGLDIRLSGKIDGVDTRFSAEMKSGFQRLDTKIDDKFGVLDTKIDGVDTRLSTEMKTGFGELNKKIDGLKDSFADFRVDVEKSFSRLTRGAIGLAITVGLSLLGILVNALLSLAHRSDEKAVSEQRAPSAISAPVPVTQEGSKKAP